VAFLWAAVYDGPRAKERMGGVSDLDTVIHNPADSQHVRAIHLHIYNTTPSCFVPKPKAIFAARSVRSSR
jgi:hypothetical protein